MSERGLLIVLSGPSGVGKGTVRQALFESAEADYEYSISMTTRPMRPGEQEGVDYFFRTREEFEVLIDSGEMLEHAEYVGNYYGTPLAYVNRTLDEGKDVFLEIEVQGALKVKEKVPNGVFIFLTPPDLYELKERIIRRGTDELSVIEKRMEVAKAEIEMMSLYDYAVINNQVDEAVAQIQNIIKTEHLRVGRVINKYKQMIKEL